MEIEIIKLPLMGSPYSFKTRKQGRRKSIENILRANHSKPKKSFIEKALKNYNGDNKFLLSIKSQLETKGLAGLSRKQIIVAERVYKSTRIS